MKCECKCECGEKIYECDTNVSERVSVSVCVLLRLMTFDGN